MSAIAIIPARGGSKRIPRKNIRDFCSKPMIAWSIEAAKASGCFERIIVSTDDEEIAEISKQWGAEVPFMRPAELADDFATTGQVMSHVVKMLSVNIPCLKFVCCIYPTAPFLDSEDIRKGLQQMKETDCDYAISVTSFPYPVQRSFRITQLNRLEMLYPDKYLTRSQDLEEIYHDAGQFYWGTAQAWINEAPPFSDRTVPIQLPRFRVQDIDTPEDWQRAEYMFQVMKLNAAES